MSDCEAFGLQPAEAAAEVVRVIAVVDTWKAHLAQIGVTQRDIENIARQVDGAYLLGQRSGFDPAEFQHIPVKKTRKSPFSRA